MTKSKPREAYKGHAYKKKYVKFTLTTISPNVETNIGDKDEIFINYSD